mgnify:CR=1 FL=1|jgi:hypothetical protein
MVPKAGFWAVGGADISFGADGNWYSDGDKIENPRIAALFSRHVRGDGEGGWVIDIGIDRQAVTVEDTALVVVAVSGGPESGFRIRTNDGIEEELDCSSLTVGDGNVLYCEVDRGERGSFRARMLRHVYYHLAADMEESPEGTTLCCKGSRFLLPVRG